MMTGPPTTHTAGKRAIQFSAVNTRGFPALPNELYLEILNHLPAFPIPHDVWLGAKRDRYRQFALYHLSQTCRSLRNFFLRYAWERIEVFEDIWTPCKHFSFKPLAQETLRQFETVVVRNPDLRKYVTTVDLTIPTSCSSPYKTLLLIAQYLTLLPNLHTLQLICDSYPLGKDFFSEFRYPTVHTVIVSFFSAVQDVLFACPNARHFSFYEDRGDWFHFRDRITGGCNIEKLGMMKGCDLPLLVRKLPRLRDISLHSRCLRISNKYKTFNCLSSLPLHTIRLRLDNRYWQCRDVSATPDERRSWIELAMGVLAKCPQNEMAKRVVVVNDDKTVVVYHL